MRRLLVALLAVTMTACAPVWQQEPGDPAETLWLAHQQQQAEMGDWAFRGRTVIIQGKEGWNAGISWQEQGENYLIKLSGPFAQGGIILDGNDRQVTLTLDDGEKMTAATPEQLLAEAMGWLLPVSALRDWIRGIPYSQLPVDSQQLDAKGRLTLLKQAGWEIEFLRYMPFENYSMPSKVFMKHPDLSVRLVVSDWRRPK
ncbi:lipoprotein insertase outer membrane protein LolB [Methylophaga sp. OBS4]|uniref:lipoprotein insertase outer membrane protein LolB n=1 Tax=Methylophaga sp. OBS4 TaxID=2991935 RepID=UPI002259ABDB|nr:lipoprotein insertase outer membrane protein LolB [Methylophaga sp. OBS4]MCX4187011.1 lipoprotein insertase outer membrane protein LolB [Methylophaga sp. OBS4]